MKVDYKRDVTVTLTLNEKEAVALAQLCVQVGGVSCLRLDFYHDVWREIRAVVDVPPTVGVFTFAEDHDGATHLVSTQQSKRASRQAHRLTADREEYRKVWTVPFLHERPHRRRGALTMVIDMTDERLRELAEDPHEVDPDEVMWMAAEGLRLRSPNEGDGAPSSGGPVG